MDDLYSKYVCLKTNIEAIIQYHRWHKDIAYSLAANLNQFYKNIEEKDDLFTLLCYMQSAWYTAPNYRTNTEYLENNANFKPVWKQYKRICRKSKEPLSIKEYLSFTRMNFTPSDKFLCDCCVIYDGTAVFQLNVINLERLKDTELTALDDWDYYCVSAVNQLYDIKYSRMAV